MSSDSILRIEFVPLLLVSDIDLAGAARPHTEEYWRNVISASYSDCN